MIDAYLTRLVADFQRPARRDMRRIVLTSASSAGPMVLEVASNDSGFQEDNTLVPEFSAIVGGYESDTDAMDEDDMSLKKSKSAPVGLNATQHASNGLLKY